MDRYAVLVTLAVAVFTWSCSKEKQEQGSMGSRLAACELAAKAGKPCSIKPDLDLICDVSTRINAGALTSQQGVELVTASLSTAEGVRVFQEVGTAQPKDKHRVMVAAAEAGGVAGYRCPTFEVGTSTTAPSGTSTVTAP